MDNMLKHWKDFALAALAGGADGSKAIGYASVVATEYKRLLDIEFAKKQD